nr:GNAT family N-acetyltransferase [Micromonospora sp. KC606]
MDFRGYATEAALTVLAHGFDTLGLSEILAVTTATNLRSQAVMRRIGMTRDPVDDFRRPYRAPKGHCVRTCCTASPVVRGPDVLRRIA